jgi:predicted transcriptional regulator
MLLFSPGKTGSRPQRFGLMKTSLPGVKCSSVKSDSIALRMFLVCWTDTLTLKTPLAKMPCLFYGYTITLLQEPIMQLARTTIESCISTLPDVVDPEEVMYRLYLLEKIEAGEKDIKEGKTLHHDEVVERLSSRWLN